jgi:hypothetical protein
LEEEEDDDDDDDVSAARDNSDDDNVLVGAGFDGSNLEGIIILGLCTDVNA